MWDHVYLKHLWSSVNQYPWLTLDPYLITVAARYNKPRYNKDSVTTNNIWKPSRITVKYAETNPTITNHTITNRFGLSQPTIYPTLMNIFSCRLQSVKTTWWYKWLISQTWLILFKIGKLRPSKLYLNVAVHVQVCRLFCMVYIPFFSLVTPL